MFPFYYICGKQTIKTMATGFYLKNKNGKSSVIFAIVRYNGERYKRSVGISTEVRYWNADSQTCREIKDYPRASSVNIRLRKVKQACDAVCDEMTAQFQILNSDEFWKRVDLLLTGTRSNKMLFLEYAKTYAERREKTDNHNTAKQYLTTYNKLVEFEKQYREHLRFEDINLRFYNKLKQFMRNQGYADSYFAMLAKCIKVIYRDARDVDGLHDLHETEKRGFSTTQTSPKTIYLSLEELEQIYKVKITRELIIKHFPELANLPPHKMELKIATLNTVRNKFLIGAYTALRVSDYNRMTDINVDGNFIKITTRKTGAAVVIPIHPTLRKIIDSGFNLATPISEQKINQHIKEIARCAGITKLTEGVKIVNGRSSSGYWKKCDMITTHTARRSGATNMYKAGIPTLSIMYITGHKTERAFLKYIKITQEENAELMAKNTYFSTP